MSNPVFAFSPRPLTHAAQPVRQQVFPHRVILCQGTGAHGEEVVRRRDAGLGLQHRRQRQGEVLGVRRRHAVDHGPQPRAALWGDG